MASFEWDEDKNQENRGKHGIDFETAQQAFSDPNRIIYKDLDHSTETEARFFCLGIVEKEVCTVRFTERNKKIRIFGAGFWRKERKIYEKENEDR
jgi:uncharacterized DUF497 family protein